MHSCRGFPARDQPEHWAEAPGRPPCQPHRFAVRQRSLLSEHLRMRTHPRGTLSLIRGIRRGRIADRSELPSVPSVPSVATSVAREAGRICQSPHRVKIGCGTFFRGPRYPEMSGVCRSGAENSDGRLLPRSRQTSGRSMDAVHPDIRMRYNFSLGVAHE